ncbi:MAG: aminodeoxychorismate/anthranilate synthase component II [Clostridiales bacterium GWF2_36_10]|nr:MAG: aminodeoxychorismate/anthranilate synthase component II [Clostridiales bacterium GWF2_36_10]HAN20383.1 aminodeoxychorismate/anthranilate synthase component II [Clostridiales bacterium]
MVLLIDNYDSFSYNVYQLIGEFYPDIKVIRNDELNVEEIEELKPKAIILSPGPGKPIDAGVCIEVVKVLGEKIPILGICLGHQAICEAFGTTVTYAKKLMHGKTSQAALDINSSLFKGMNSEIQVARYHSLAAVRETLPTFLRITSETTDGEIMAVEHNEYKIFGLQFHPESVLTPDGKQIISNFIGEINHD